MNFIPYHVTHAVLNCEKGPFLREFLNEPDTSYSLGSAFNQCGGKFYNDDNILCIFFFFFFFCIQEIPENGADIAHLHHLHTPFLAAGRDLRYHFTA